MTRTLPPGARALAGFTLLLGIGFSAVAQTGHLQFAGARQDYPSTGALAIGDFNGDGFPDIATTDGSASLIILLDDGTGHYVKSATLPGLAGSYFAVGDFNNDGLLDVAFTNYNSVNIALGAGNGTLRSVFTATGLSAGDLVVTDLNGDGNLDVVVGSYQVGYLLGNGDGTLRSFTVLPNITSPFVVADLNGDKRPDVAAIYQNGQQYNIATYLNNSDGIFKAGPVSPVAVTGGFSLAAGDLDGNFTVDLVLGATSPSASITVLKGDGKGDFVSAGSLSLPFQPDHVALLDVNSDGRLDLAYTRISRQSLQPATNLSIQLGNGDGTFGAAANYATGGADYRILLADTRGNGQRDLITSGSQYFSVLFNRGNNTFVQGSFFKLDGVLQTTVAADFNRDGRPDLAVVVRLSANGNAVPDVNSQFAGAYILTNTGDPKSLFSTGQRLYVPPDVFDVTSADFNNDGNPDLAFVTGQNLVIYLGAGDGTFTPGAQYPCSCFHVATGDFNGDGNVDIATSGVYVYLGNGNGTFRNPTLPFVGGNAFLGVADLNGDGKADILSAPPNSSSLLAGLGNGDGTFTVKASTGPYGVISGIIADLNNDGAPDLTLLAGSNIYVLINGGQGGFTQLSAIYVGSQSKANTIALADFNQDGYPDLILPGLDIRLYIGIGGGLLSTTPYSFGAANYPNVLVTGDFYDFGTGQLPDMIGVGQNGAISTMIDVSH